jgi:cytochrome c
MRIGLGIMVMAALVAATAHAHSASANESLSYTQAQASTGHRIFEARCSACHGATLQGIVAPALAGPHSAVKGKTAANVFDFIAHSMPLGAPGSLSRDQYVQIMAFLLKENGHRSNRASLTYRLVRHSAMRI